VFLLNAVTLLAALILLFTFQPQTPILQVGEVSDRTVVVQHKLTYIDHLATNARRRQAMQGTPPAYVGNTRPAVQRLHDAQTFFNSVRPVITGNGTYDQKVTAVRRLEPPYVLPANLNQLATLNKQDFEVVRTHSLSLLSQAVQWHFSATETTTTEIELLSTVSPHLSVLQRSVIGQILAAFITPTEIVDPSATKARQQAAAEHVAPVVGTMYPGEVIVRSGDIVTAHELDQLKALGLEAGSAGWQGTAASGVFAALVLATLFWFLHAFHPGYLANPRLLLLIDASILVSVAGSRFLTNGHVVLPYFLPVAAASIFAAALTAPEAAIAIALAIAILAGWVTSNSFEVTIYYFLTGAVGALAIQPLRTLKQFIFAGLYVMLFGMLTSLAFALVDRSYDAAALREYLFAAVFNGFVSSTLALGGFALLSGYFRITTTLQLLELGQPSHPLLRRLMARAPGTYNHSLILASMMEHAADEIGMNALVAKICALYHDVGKTQNPLCFAENQLGQGNIHDDLRPEESARIIRGHVGQGLKLAHQHRLPRFVLDAIAEHHGTTQISYFLHRAREQSEGPVDLTLFTYGGPKPQTKESALLMLADVCESTVRAMGDHSPARIRETVDRIFRERIESGQLDESPLTLRDIELAREAFLSVLNGLYHPRVEYPEAEQPQAQRAEQAL
jgi:putative nucleotidyltransferase with HDIG domain